MTSPQLTSPKCRGEVGLTVISGEIICTTWQKPAGGGQEHDPWRAFDSIHWSGGCHAWVFWCGKFPPNIKFLMGTWLEYDPWRTLNSIHTYYIIVLVFYMANVGSQPGNIGKKQQDVFAAAPQWHWVMTRPPEGL
ncbi:hypothetical protein EDD22DRAFT_853217 [Suillus occidentalis]|nr:hypothetical protein EDD22DRAFT_853217 [Suillus occidentalis]